LASDEVKYTQHKVVPQAEYDQLVAEAHMLQCLRDAGVDNWDGYSDAVREWKKEYPTGEGDGYDD
jgi:hypothetical protein